MNEIQEPIELPESVIPGKSKKSRKKSKKAKPEPVEVGKQPVKNGVPEPRPDTLCGKAWAIFNVLFKQKGEFTIADAVKVGNKKGLNPGNVKTEFYCWRKFHGVKA